MEKQAASLYEDDIAISIIKDLGKIKSRELLEEEQVDTYLHKNFPGVKFTLSEIGEIETQLKKKLKLKKRADFVSRRADYDTRIGDRVSTIKGNGVVVSVPAVNGEVIIKLESGDEETFSINEIKTIREPRSLEVGVDGSPEMGYGGNMPGVNIEPARTMDLQSSIKLNANNKFVVVAGEKVSKEFDTFEEAIREKQAAITTPKPTEQAPEGYEWCLFKKADLPPKPTTPAPEGMQYFWNKQTNAWELTTKQS